MLQKKLNVFNEAKNGARKQVENLQRKWDFFLKTVANAGDIIETEKYHLFLHGWDRPDRHVTEYHAALWTWRAEVMKNLSLDEPHVQPTIEPIDPGPYIHPDERG